MAKADLTRESFPVFEKRIAALNSDTERLWGTMDAGRMLRHLRGTFEISLGEVEVADRSLPIVRTLIRLLFFEWFTNWPKGKIKAPVEYTPPVEKEFAEERILLLETIERFLGEMERDPTRETINPPLGKVSLRYWAHVHGLHMDHHLRQFGV